MNWKGEKVLVTGANGFVGSWVAKALAEKGAELIVPIKDINEHGNLKILNINSKVIECDLSEENCVNKMFEKNEVDAVFHLAAQAIVGIEWKYAGKKILKELLLLQAIKLMEIIKNFLIRKHPHCFQDILMTLQKPVLT